MQNIQSLSGSIRPAAHAKPSNSGFVRAVSLCTAVACLLACLAFYPSAAPTASAASNSMASLQNRLDKLSQSIAQHKKDLSNAKKREAAAKAMESELREKVTVVQGQISVLKGQIAQVQNQIGQTQQAIAQKEAEDRPKGDRRSQTSGTTSSSTWLLCSSCGTAAVWLCWPRCRICTSC